MLGSTEWNSMALVMGAIDFFVQRYIFYIIYQNNCIYFLRKIVLAVRWDNVCICGMVF